MMELSPDAGAVLVSDFDKDASPGGTVTASGHDEFVEWEWSISPEPPSPVFVTPAGASLTAGWASQLRALFPIEQITYIIPGTLADQATVTEWADVPAGADIIRFRPSLQSVRELTLSVTAHGIVYVGAGPTSPGTPEPVSVSGSYTIQVVHHHDQHRDTLKERVNASRHAIR